MMENETMNLDKLIADAKELSKEKDTLARTFRGFKDYGNPKSTITSGAEKAQGEAEQYEHISKLFEELKSYRAIGTVEEFKALKEVDEDVRLKYCYEDLSNADNLGYLRGYNEAIDEFVEQLHADAFLHNFYGENKFVQTVEKIDEIAQRLKD